MCIRDRCGACAKARDLRQPHARRRMLDCARAVGALDRLDFRDRRSAELARLSRLPVAWQHIACGRDAAAQTCLVRLAAAHDPGPVSYTHLRAHETVLDLVCRLLLEKKK